MGATLVIGILLMLVRGQLTSDPAVQDTILQFGSGLASFGFTTLLVTVFATKVLETQLVGRVGDEIRKHVDEVGASLRDTTKGGMPGALR